MGVWIEMKKGDFATKFLVAPYAGAWIERKSDSRVSRLHTFLCERNFLLFFLRVLSMYLTDTTVTFPVFRAFLHFLVTVEDSKSRLQGKDGTAIRIAWLFLPVFVAACEGFCSKSRPFQRTFQSV